MTTFSRILHFFSEIFFSEISKYRDCALESVSFCPTKCAQKCVFLWTTDSSRITFVLAQSCAMQRKFLFPPIAPHIDKHQRTVRHGWWKPSFKKPCHNHGNRNAQLHSIKLKKQLIYSSFFAFRFVPINSTPSKWCKYQRPMKLLSRRCREFSSCSSKNWQELEHCECYLNFKSVSYIRVISENSWILNIRLHFQVFSHKLTSNCENWSAHPVFANIRWLSLLNSQI